MSDSAHDYHPSKIESKWQQFWKENEIFHARDFEDVPTFYVMDMFPYPSGAGLHIGHPEGYTATDALKRMKKAQGVNVLHPMGWDAFGLPTEQYALQTGEPPAKVTQQNIARFKEQLEQIGLVYDWEREVNTTDPHYVKWTQWIFRELFHHGLAYVEEKPVWFCPALGTVLANEEVLNTPEGPRSERGSHPVERRPIRQWVLRITQYADKLLNGLEGLDWPDSTKRLQKNWIGKSVGAEVNFTLQGLSEASLCVFTTRPDTLFGVTYMVLAPEHPLVAKLTTAEQQAAVAAYIEQAKSKSDLERAELSKDKSGVFTGGYAINPVNGEKVPVWVADYVLMSYGTGAIMAVPAHDERDFEFAQKFGIEIKQVIFPEGTSREQAASPAALTEAFTEEGVLWNSGDFDGLDSTTSKDKVTEAIAAAGKGKQAVNFKLRDWLFSRQRYWGEPFPILWVSKEDYATIKNGKGALAAALPKEAVTCQMDGKEYFAVAIPEEELPLHLPQLSDFKPSPDGQSPLARAQNWVNVWVNLQTGQAVPQEDAAGAALPPSDESEWLPARRETNTMPQWAGSCWYYLRYIDPHNDDALVDRKKAKYWGMPDLYVGGAEHAVLHLLYARFWHIFLHEIGVVDQPEPFRKLFHQGIILGEDGEKMSKSRGNVISPETIIEEHGADALRLYLMFIGPLEAMKPWDTKGILGITRFLRKTWHLVVDGSGKLCTKIGAEEAEEITRLRHETIKKVTADYESLSFNTAISQMMIFVNALSKADKVERASVLALVQLLAPLAPHLAEELWLRLGEATEDRPSVAQAPWPQYDPSKLVQQSVKLMVQVLGKLRGELTVALDAPQAEVVAAAKALASVKPFIEGKQIVKEIYVPNRIVNLVVK